MARGQQRDGRGRGGRGGGGREGRGRGRRGGAPPPPSGEALHVELAATPAFYASVQGKECPAQWVEGEQGGATPLGTSMLALRSWRDLAALVLWFREGLAADPQAELAFSPRLTKAHRASVHSTTTAVTRAALGTVSRGVGDARRVVVLSQERAQRPELDEKGAHQAYWTWRWAVEEGLQARGWVSRDEVAEMVSANTLTPELATLWQRRSDQQRAVQALCAAAAAGDVAGAEAALAQHPSLLSGGVFDVLSGAAPLHVAALNGQLQLLELLLSRGASPTQKDGHGLTAAEVARRHDQGDAEGLLLRAGAPEPEKERWAQRVALPGDDAGADSVASVCGTDRDPMADLGSNLSDWGDQQATPASPSVPPLPEEEQQGETAAGEREGQEEASAAVAAESARAQVEAVELASKAQAQAEAAAAAAEEEAEEEEDDEDEAAAEAEDAEEAAQEEAVVAFEQALAAAEAAEAAAEAAEAMPGEEAAQRAAAFRREGEAAIRAAAAAAVVAGDSLDEVFTPRHPAAQAPAAEVATADGAAAAQLPRMAELHPAVASAAEQATSAARSAAAASSKAAEQARAQLEARLPAWVQENPGSVAVGVGVAAAAIAAVLLMRRR